MAQTWMLMQKIANCWLFGEKQKQNLWHKREIQCWYKQNGNKPKSLASQHIADQVQKWRGLEANIVVPSLKEQNKCKEKS